jgi:deoxyribonuclease-2
MAAIKAVLLLCIFSVLKTNALDCRDGNGNAVDWFIALKTPKLHDHGSIVEEGYGYVYVTSEDAGSWTLSDVSIADDNSIVGNTLTQFYENKNDLSYVVYNDAPPTHSQSSTKGHTKGVVVADTTGGFWLIHSLPKFPDVENSYFYPDNGKKYGQSFICISMDLENINKVGLQLQYNQPFIYSEQILSDIKSKVPDLAKAAANTTIASAPWSNVAQINSKNNVAFTSFAKHAQFNQELYADLVAPTLESDLAVESWASGSGRLSSDCSGQFSVYNIHTISIPVDNIEYKTTVDHANWAVSTAESGSSWVCVGDIIRSEHQKLRGGGTICLSNENLAGYFQALIGTTEECGE